MTIFELKTENGREYRVTIENKSQMNRMHKLIHESEGKEKIISKREILNGVQSLAMVEKLCARNELESQGY